MRCTNGTTSPVLAVGVLLGSSFPDITEIVSFFGRRRLSLIPHRTITHWAPFYLIAWFAVNAFASKIPWWSLDLVHGICMASVLHILLDLFSPTGVPIVSPFGGRVSFGFNRGDKHPCLYRTGSTEEIPIIAATVLCILMFLVPRYAPISFGTLLHYFS